MQEQLDRIEGKIDKLIAGLTDKRSPFDRTDDGAPDPVQPIAGFDKVFGPKPHPSDATAGTVWRNEAKKVTTVYDDIPGRFEAGAMELAARTGVKAIFLEYNGQTKACLRPGLPPWLVDANNFIGSGVEGLIRAVLDSQK